MTDVREGVSGGSTNTRRAGRIVPPRSIGETAAAAAACVSPASSPAQLKASLSRTASRDANPEPDVEASAARSSGAFTHQRPVLPSPCIRANCREPHGVEDAPSSVASLSASSPAYSKFSSSRAAACDTTDPKPEPEVEGSAGKDRKMLPKICATGGRQGHHGNHEPHGSEVVSSSVAPSADKEQRRLPTRIDSAKSSAILENIGLQKTRKPSQLQREVGADSDRRDSHVSGKKPLAMSPREPIRFHFPRHPSVLDKRGNILTAGCPKQEQSSVSAWKGESYMTTLGPGGGYGYPHPPPFYRCEICHKTAFYWLKCCQRGVCECCGCVCESAETEKNKRLQYQREKLPKVKLEGSDLFLWQPFSFPHKQMLWMAKRRENHLQYYFAPIDKLMNPKDDSVKVCVYDFCQQGHDVTSLSKTEITLARNLLH